MKFIVRWDAGYGNCYDIAEVENEEEELDYAAECWKEAAESQADYEVIGEATEELLEEYDLY